MTAYTAGMGPIYAANEADSRTVEMEGLTLLFHARSGMTHILAPPSPQILEVLREPGDVAAVLKRLEALFELPPEAEAAVVARLEELEASGLVRRA